MSTCATAQAVSTATKSPEVCSEVERAFLRCLDQVFERLREAGVPFCILRNRDRIPASLITGSDVDVIVPAGTPVEKLVSILADLRPAHIVPHRATLEMYFRVRSLYLHVDFLIADREWRGARYLENRDILLTAREDRGMPVASELHQAFCAWFSSLTRKRRFKERYIPLIYAAAAERGAQLGALLRRAFGRRLGGRLLELAQRKELAGSSTLANRCRRAISSRALMRRPIRTIRNFLLYYWAEAQLYARSAGLCVAVLGPDGAGKSTVCSVLARSNRAELPFSSIEIQHMYQRALPRLSELKKGRIRRKPLAPATTHDPHGKPPHHPWVSAFCLAYGALDQWLSRLRWGRWKLARNMLVLHDRHMLEIVVDPTRFRYAGSPRLARWFVRSIPKPDLIVLLDVPAEVLQSRKQEVPFEETQRQRQAYRELVGSMTNGVVLDAQGSAEDVAARVREIILAHMARRTALRFGVAAGASPEAVAEQQNRPGLVLARKGTA